MATIIMTNSLISVNLNSYARRVFHFPKRVEVRTSCSPRNNFSATYHNTRYTSQESREHRQNCLISPSQYFGKVLNRITYSFRLAWAQRTHCIAAETKSSSPCVSPDAKLSGAAALARQIRASASGVAAVSCKGAARASLARRIGA